MRLFMFWDFMEKATKDSSFHSSCFKRSSTHFCLDLYPRPAQQLHWEMKSNPLLAAEGLWYWWRLLAFRFLNSMKKKKWTKGLFSLYHLVTYCTKSIPCCSLHKAAFFSVFNCGLFYPRCSPAAARSWRYPGKPPLLLLKVYAGADLVQ